MISFHRDIIRLRRENDELRKGSIKYVDSDYNFIAYGRFHRQGQCAILVNNNNYSITKEVFVWDLGTPKHGRMKVLLWTDENGYSMERDGYEVVAGKIRIELPRTCAVILKYVND